MAAKEKPLAKEKTLTQETTTTKEKHYDKDMSSIQALETRCNSNELNIPGKLQKLEAAINTDNVHVTVATYEKIPRAVGVGNLKIKEDSTGTHSAWIKDTKTKISFSR